jgi:precorrin-2 dehydrogenase/sirohydrochlorin ferrochelatase
LSEWYPVMLKIGGRLSVICGGGRVAERKAQGLLEAGALVRIVSPGVTEKLESHSRTGRLEWIQKEFENSDLAGASLVFAATDDPAVNRRIAEAARELGIPVNSADDGESGDFILPAVLRRGEFILAAGVSGGSPALAARVIRELTDRYGPEYAEYAGTLRRIRTVVKSVVEDPEERRSLLQTAAEESVLEAWNGADPAADPVRLLECLRHRAAQDSNEN